MCIKCEYEILCCFLKLLLYLLFILLFNESPLIRKGEIIESKVDIQPFLLPNKNINAFTQSTLWCTEPTTLFLKFIEVKGSFLFVYYFESDYVRLGYIGYKVTLDPRRVWHRNKTYPNYFKLS